MPATVQPNILRSNPTHPSALAGHKAEGQDSTVRTCICVYAYIYTHNIMQQVHFLLYYITSSGIVIHIKYSILIYCTLLYLVIPYLISYYVNYNTRSSQIILLYTVLLFLHVQLL